MVPRAVKIPAGTLAERSRALLTKLKRAKGNTYGNVRPAFKPDVKAGEVYILHLDGRTDSKYRTAIVIAETTSTRSQRTEPRKVIFLSAAPKGDPRGHSTQPVARHHFWRVLPPARMGNIVRLTSGDLFTADQIIDKLKTGDAQMVKIF